MKKKWQEAKGASESQIFPTYLILSQGNWFYLFHMLLLAILIYPYLEVAAQLYRPWLFNVLDMAIAITIVYTVSYSLKQFLGALFLGGLSIASHFFPESAMSMVLLMSSTLLLYAYTIMLILAYLSHTKEFSANEVYGSISVYILLGLSWAVLYQMIEFCFPQSFYLTPAANLDKVLTWSDFLFFSFTTLTTLGYGDMLPVSSQARSLAILESLTGVVFMAVVVSRSIGLYLAQKK